MPGFSQRNIPFRRERHARRKRRFLLRLRQIRTQNQEGRLPGREGKGNFSVVYAQLAPAIQQQIQLEAFPRLWNRDFPFVAMDGGFIHQHVNPVRFPLCAVHAQERVCRRNMHSGKFLCFFREARLRNDAAKIRFFGALFHEPDR